MFSRNKPKEQQDIGKYDRIHVVRSPGSALAEMIDNPPDGSVKTTITPKLAVAMLAYNKGNRPVRGGKVSLYARQMRAGEWRYTREPIIFSDAGRVIDGQHRLLACAESGTSIVADIAFGAPDESFAFIDVGAGRGASDIFAINGVKNYNAMSGMTRLVWQYDQGRVSINGGCGLTAAELYREYLQLPGLEDSLPTFHRFQRSRIASQTVMGALHYICARKNRRESDRFFVEVDEGGAGTSPARELHRRLVRNAISSEKIGSDGIAGLVLTAWNRNRRGLSGRGLSFTAGKLPAVM